MTLLDPPHTAARPAQTRTAPERRPAEAALEAAALLLPEGTRLLHIGPAKTGTTSLQSGFHRNRAGIKEHGVHYAGGGSQPRAAAAAVAINRRVAGHRYGMEAWPRLVAEVQRSTAKRVVISSETFARARDEGAKATIEAFGADRTHVVITMRPLVDMLSSSWQQYVQTGSAKRYEQWLDEMLNSPDTLHGLQPEFWQKTRIDALAQRWGALVGFENVTVVSLADRPRDFVLRTFERFTGLPEGTLVPDPDAENASLSFGVAETVRRFNALFKEQPGVSPDLQARLVEFGAIRHLRRTPEALRAGDRIEVPQWAADRAAAITREMNAGLRALGVRIVGDLDALAQPTKAPVAAVETPATVGTEASAALLVGMMLAAREPFASASTPQAREQALLAAEVLDTRDLVRLTLARLRERTRQRLRR